MENINNNSAILSNELGKVPPQSIDTEKYVIGAMLLEEGAEINVIEILEPEHFYLATHKIIFKVIVALSSKQRPVDLITVTDELTKIGELDNIGGAYYLSQLTSNAGSAANIEYYSRIIAQKFIQRELIKFASEVQTKAYDTTTDVDDLIEFTEQGLFKISNGTAKKDALPIDEIIKASLDEIKEAALKNDDFIGVPSGFIDIDKITSGWQLSDLIIVAARPSMGKTAFVLSMSRNIAVNYSKSIAFFSLEMSCVQLVNRLIVGETNIDSRKLRTGKLSDDDWNNLFEHISTLEKAKIFIDDTPAIKLSELRAKCRRLKQLHDINIIIIDYLQLMSGPKEAKGIREQEVSMISRGLKALAKELNVPVIALSQLNRSVETRTGSKRPQLSDLRESGAIEQDADIVMFIHRPEKYGLDTAEDGIPSAGLGQILIAKHRNGVVCDVNLSFIENQAKFTNYNEGQMPLVLSRDTSFTVESSMNKSADNQNKDNDPFMSNNNNVAPF